MADQANNQTGQLPDVGTTYQQAQTAPSTPNANLLLATATPQVEVVQQAVSVLMSTNLSPYQMASQFAQLKENYLAKTYGIIIE